MDFDRRKSSTASERLRAMVPWATQKARNGFNKKTLHKRMPIFAWLPKYTSKDAVGDVVAGVTVGLTIIPQSMAYANIAGLPPQQGLYGSFVCSMLYIIFGSCKDVAMGPTAILALLTYQSIDGQVENAILLCLLSGVVMFLMGVFCLGFIIDFVSGPVSSGFTSAIAVIIVSSQLKDILGLKGSGGTFVEIWKAIFANIHMVSLTDSLLGLVCLIILFTLRVFAQIDCEEEKDSTRRFLKNAVWTIGTARNALLLVACGVFSYLVSVDGRVPFKIIGHVEGGMPRVQVPPLEIVRGNVTVTFEEMFSQISTGVIVVPLVALLEHITVCKAFANGKSIDVTQELIALGLGNIANSFVHAFPGTGSLSRSAIINSSGVRTPLNCLYSGVLVIVAILFLTPYFYFIPKATLSAIIIAAVVFMVEVHVVIPIWKTKKKDVIPGLSTFLACLIFPLQYGIVIGIGINILFILYHAARPKIAIEHNKTKDDIDYLVLTPDRSLIFPSVDYVRHLVNKYSLRKACPVVIDCAHIYSVDYTAAKVLETITQDFAARKQLLFFYKLKPSVSSVFEGLEMKEFRVYFNEEELDQALRTLVPLPDGLDRV